MEGLDLKQMTAMVKVISEEKGLPEETILDIIQTAIAAAWRRDNGSREMEVRAAFDMNKGTAKVYVARTVVEDGLAYNPNTEIPEAEAKGKKVGDIVEEEHDVTSFGYVASQTAKQVVVQRLREAERTAVMAVYADKIGTIITGTVSKILPKLVLIDLGRATAVMPKSEQIDGEYYSVGSRIKVLAKSIDNNSDKGPQLVVSRGAAGFIEQLFRQEVPELETGTVEIMGIAREAGRRTKIAVATSTPGIDPVGTFVGGRGVRVQAVMNEIGEREKIDIITWSDNVSEYIREALSPAEVIKVEVEGKNAKVYVSDEQQSIAIGKQGQNVRLASKLTGYEIDIILQKSQSKKKKQNVEDSLLNAIEDSAGEETSEEA
ncbi:transcription termination/antitermination protein NusA [Candidatus Saccharibacteria bacterium]|nr:transcription termination/antitermination protein NusA [Candidatus Saccharibacteria bacterium]